MKFTPFRITIIYLLVAVIWIFTTDLILESFTDNVTLLTNLQIAKGWFYVAATAAGLYWMMVIHERQISRDKEKLEMKDRSLTLALETNKMGTWEYYPEEDGYVTSSNHHNLFEFPQSKDLTLPDVYSKIHPDDLDRFKTKADETLNYNRDFNIKYRIVLNDGSIRWLWTKGSPYQENGIIKRVSGITTDITDRIELESEIEESRERLQIASSSANIGLWEWHPQTGETIIDEVWANLVGYTLDELQPVNSDTWKELLHPDDLKEWNQIIEEYFSNDPGLYDVEIRMRHKKGRWVWILTRGRIVEWDGDGNPIRMVGTHVDITEQKEREEELQESERLLRESQRVANLGTYVIDVVTGQIKTSDILNKMLGLENEDEITLDKLDQLIHPEYKYISEKFALAMETGDTFEAEYKIISQSNGEEIWIHDKADFEKDQSGNPEKIIGTMQDVTGQKLQQKRIHQTIEQLRKAEKIAEIGYWEKNLETGQVYWGDNKFDLYGVDKNKAPLSRKEFLEGIHPRDKEETLQAYKQAEKDGKLDITYRYNRDTGYHTFHEKADIEVDEESNSRILRGISMDITSLKEMEAELQDERKRLKIISNMVSDVVCDWDLDENEIIWNEGLETKFGFDRKQIEPGIEFWSGHIHPEDLERILNSFYETIDSDRNIWKEEYRFLDADNNVRIVKDQGYIFRDSSGDAVRMIGAMVDQTEAKKTEELLSYQANLMEDISDAVISTDENLRIKSWNRAAEEMYGWNEEEVMGEKITNVLSAKYADLELEPPDNKREWFEELKQTRKDGSEIFVLSSVRLTYDPDGLLAGTVAVNKDITDLKRIQERLFFEQKRFEYVSAVVSDAIWDGVAGKKNVWWSDGLETNYGHSIDSGDEGYEIWLNNIHPDDREEVLSDIRKAEENGDKEWSKEYRFYRGDGSLATVLDRAYILRDENGDIVRMIGALNDITAEKKAEKELQRSEQQYRLLFEQSPLPMWIYDTESFRFLSVNEAATDMYGYSKEDFQNMVIFDLFLPEDQDDIREKTRENLTMARSGFDVWKQKTKSGEEIICEISGSNIYFEGNKQRLVVSVDITEQRKSEERTIRAVVEGEERERYRIANELHDGLGQYLSAANMHLSTVFEDESTLSAQEKKSGSKGLQMLRHAISETRSISHNLLPKSIQDYGLKLATEALINDMKSSQDITFYLFQKYDDEIIPDNIQINIYRIIQEAINNVIKHSDASMANTQLIYSDGELICSIEDDGIGFDAENIAGDGLGIQSMKTRAAAMSGKFDIESKKNMGTLITVIIPLSRAKYG